MVAILRPARVERTDEAAVQQAIRERLGREPDVLLFRNAQAMGERWDARTAKVSRFQGGLGTGSADLVGILARTLATRTNSRAEPVGQIRWDTVGVFFALEVKRARGGRVSEAQAAWIKLVRRFGGFACVVCSVDDALAALERARMGCDS